MKTKTKPVVKTGDEENIKSSEEPPAPKIPPVVLAGLEATCVVKPGDPFPDATLKDIAGADQALSKLRGERATVVLLWGQSRAGRGALKTIAAKAAQEQPGIRYLSVFVGGTGDTAKQAVEAGALRSLVDQDLSFSQRVIKPPEGGQIADLLPRAYLLDPAGKILWMSPDLGTAAERDLEAAIEFVLKQP